MRMKRTEFSVELFWKRTSRMYTNYVTLDSWLLSSLLPRHPPLTPLQRRLVGPSVSTSHCGKIFDYALPLSCCNIVSIFCILLLQERCEQIASFHYRKAFILKFNEIVVLNQASLRTIRILLEDDLRRIIGHLGSNIEVRFCVLVYDCQKLGCYFI